MSRGNASKKIPEEERRGNFFATIYACSGKGLVKIPSLTRRSLKRERMLISFHRWKRTFVLSVITILSIIVSGVNTSRKSYANFGSPGPDGSKPTILQHFPVPCLVVIRRISILIACLREGHTYTLLKTGDRVVSHLSPQFWHSAMLWENCLGLCYHQKDNSGYIKISERARSRLSPWLSV